MTSLFEMAPMMPAQEAVALLKPWNRLVSVLEFCGAAVQQELQETAACDRPGDELSREGLAVPTAQVQVMIEAARDQAVFETRCMMEAEMDGRLAQERARVEMLSAEFARDRERYFAAVEIQVVRLALAVARRILAREIAAEEMPLAGTVRAALSRVREGCRTKLRVRQQEVDGWGATLRCEVERGLEIVGDSDMRAAECSLETDVGVVELGMDSQMAEVERSFSDLMYRKSEKRGES